MRIKTKYIEDRFAYYLLLEKIGIITITKSENKVIAFDLTECTCFLYSEGKYVLTDVIINSALKTFYMFKEFELNFIDIETKEKFINVIWWSISPNIRTKILNKYNIEELLK